MIFCNSASLLVAEEPVEHGDGGAGQQGGEDVPDQVLAEEVVALVHEEGERREQVVQELVRRGLLQVVFQVGQDVEAELALLEGGHKVGGADVVLAGFSCSGISCRSNNVLYFAPKS